MLDVLKAYGRMSRRPPRVGLVGWDEVMFRVIEARFDTSYFWFLGDGPTLLDRIDTAHTPRLRTRIAIGRPKVDPARLPHSKVKYYSDPLTRLVRLHRSSSEMTTGLTFRSPFERADPRFR